jgi:hypothetical protein
LYGTFTLSPDCPCASGRAYCSAANTAVLKLFGGTRVIDRASFDLRGTASIGLTPPAGALFYSNTALSSLLDTQVTVYRSRSTTGQGYDVTCDFASNLVERLPVGSSAFAASLSAAVEHTVTLTNVEDLAIFAAEGKTATLPNIYVKTPAGQTFTPTTIAQLPGAWYATDPATNLAEFAVKSAAAGTWTVGEDKLAAGDVEFTVLTPQPPPQTAFTSVQVGGGSVAISLSVTPASAATTVDLYYSRTMDGLPEGAVATGLPATAGTITTSWDTSVVPSGEYQLFASTNDGVNGPITTTYPQTITIDVGGLAAPTNLQASRGSTTAALTWTKSTSSSVVGYNVLYTDTPDTTGYPLSASAALATGMTVMDLDRSKSYRFCVVGYDLNGNSSPYSTSVVVGPGRGEARRHLPPLNPPPQPTPTPTPSPTLTPTPTPTPSPTPTPTPTPPRTPTPTPTPTSPPASGIDLAVYKPSNWAGCVVCNYRQDGPPPVTESLVADSPTYVYWSVANLGTATLTQPITFGFYLDGALLFKSSPWDPSTLNPPGLPGSSYVSFNPMTVTVPTGGQHTISVTVDPDSQIPDINRSNNTCGFTGTWTGASPTPTPTPTSPPAGGIDLVVYRPSSWANCVVCNYRQNGPPPVTEFLVTGTTYVYWAVANLGTATVTQPITFGFYLDGALLFKTTWPNPSGLQGGYYQAFNPMMVTVSTPGQHTVSVVVDPDHQIPETNESNNTCGFTGNWSGVL